MKIENMPGMERRWTALEVAEILAVNMEGDARITGYAARFYDGTTATEYQFKGKIRRKRNSPLEETTIYERILPGAFNRIISGESPNRFDTACLFNHDKNILLGRRSAGTLKLTVDERGLRFEAMPYQDAQSLRIMSQISRREINGCSFGFGDVEETLEEENRDGEKIIVRNIKRIGKLYDVGPVTFPAYTSTDVFVRDLFHEEPSEEINLHMIDADLKIKEHELFLSKFEKHQK